MENLERSFEFSKKLICGIRICTHPIFANSPANFFFPFSFQIPILPATYPECNMASCKFQCLNRTNLNSSLREMD